MPNAPRDASQRIAARVAPARTAPLATPRLQRARAMLSAAVTVAVKNSPARVALVLFSAMILGITALLELPISTVDHTRTPFVDALFTAVSGVCVTGLVTVNTGAHWSTFGLTVLMVAMQVGGLGVLTLASMLGLSVSRHMGLTQRLITARETKSERLSEVGSVLRTIIITSLGLELLTFLALTPHMIANDFRFGQSMFFGAFYAISAFNNVGFMPEAQGTAQYVGDPWFSIPIALAVFVGSLGFPVIMVLARRWRTPRRWTLHTKLTLSTTTLVLAVAFVVISALEWSNPKTLGAHDFWTRLLAGGFAAVMPRSGGLSTLDVADMHETTRLVMDLMMFIGGGSGSTSGGIKVTTFALLILAMAAEARGNRDVEAFSRRIPHETIRQAITVVFVSAAVIFLAVAIQLSITAFSLDQLLFEVLSAYGTVGLSTGITGDLPPASKYVLIACMYFGRVGPMTLGAALALRERSKVIRLPEERPIVG